MTRAVFDTNVLASGFIALIFGASTPGELIRRWLAGEFDLAVSRPILAELERTLHGSYFANRLSLEERASALSVVQSHATMTELTIVVRGVATHPEDDLILATALSAGADYLVTGDNALLALGSYEGVTILSPRAFLDLLSTNQPD